MAVCIQRELILTIEYGIIVMEMVGMFNRIAFVIDIMTIISISPILDALINNFNYCFSLQRMRRVVLFGEFNDVLQRMLSCSHLYCFAFVWFCFSLVTLFLLFLCLVCFLWSN